MPRPNRIALRIRYQESGTLLSAIYSISFRARTIAPKIWIGPATLAFALLIELVLLLSHGPLNGIGGEVTAKQVGIALYGPYLLAVELASMLLLGGLVAAYHLGRNE